MRHQEVGGAFEHVGEFAGRAGLAEPVRRELALEGDEVVLVHVALGDFGRDARLLGDDRNGVGGLGLEHGEGVP